ncbi:MAG TPA: molybdopterin cofactor-binding domain-containing protein, partial [Jatrophihabitans sp.]|nr:molybdopterin cofactor-binding domain-containing protein [Jatrophihabitans sp.]
MTELRPVSIGTGVRRTEGRDKVTGAARYAYEYQVAGVAYLWPVQSVVARGTVTGLDEAAALAVPGVLAVLWHGNAPELGETEDAELAVLQSDRVSYRGQLVAAVVAESLEAAREAAGRLVVRYDEQPHKAVLSPDDPQLYTPEKVNPAYPADTSTGSLDEAIAAAAHLVDATYRTPALHNNPMEPHASIARWQDGELTV